MRTKLVLLATVAAAIGAWSASAQNPAGIFTQGQVDLGRQAYNASCANCHLTDLSGATDAPALAGSAFMVAWRARTAEALFTKVKSMPPGRAGSMDDATYLAITSYILRANGAATGNTALTAT